MAYFAELEDCESEGDVEMKLIAPLLFRPEGLGYFNEDVKNKSYMAPTTIDKGAGKTRGYYPDFTIVLNSLPVMVIEVKKLNEPVEEGFRQGQHYAQEVNKRWPTGFNPVKLVISCNGHAIMYGPWDSEEATTIPLDELMPGAANFEEFRLKCQRSTLLKDAIELRKKLTPTQKFRALNLIGGAAKRDQPLETNEFARELAPVLREYFDTSNDRTDALILERAYVPTTENSHYDGVLESLLKDNLSKLKHPDFEVIETSRKEAGKLDRAIRTATRTTTKVSAPFILLIGGVGSGKSIFIDKYFHNLIDESVRRRTLLVMIDLNSAPENLETLDEWIVATAREDLPRRNGLPDFGHYDNLHKYFGLEIKELRNGPYKRLAETQPEKFQDKVDEHVAGCVKDKSKYLRAAVAHYGAERGMAVLVAFDNADRRDAVQQLKIFQAVQHFRHTYKAFCVLSLRDETYHRYKDEQPLDAFYKPFLFMIQPPHFLDIARERMKLVIEELTRRAPKKTNYTVSTGASIEFPASELGKYLWKIYNSTFSPTKPTRYLFEALAGRNMRTALEMFGQVVMSPHFATDQIFATRFKDDPNELSDWQIIRILMKRNFVYYRDREGNFIHNLFSSNEKSDTCNLFATSAILYQLKLTRKVKGEMNIEGIRLVSKLIDEVSDQGFLGEDVIGCLIRMLKNGLIIADHQRTDSVTRDNYVKITASGYYHITRLINEPEYINNVSTDTWLRNARHAEDLKTEADLQHDLYDLDFDRIRRKLQVFGRAVLGEAQGDCAMMGNLG